MKPRVDARHLRDTTVGEHLVRFVFGGGVAVATGLVAHRWGPEIGGLFLAFPAILPASLTLVKEHDGRARALDDARGARLGVLALAAFAGTAWLLAPRIHPALALALAMLMWLAVGVAGWMLEFGRPAR
jgi:hypothetical protein